MANKYSRRLEALEKALIPRSNIVFVPDFKGDVKMNHNGMISTLTPSEHKAEMKQLEREGKEYLNLEVHFV